jgi:hypothetical protein
MERARAFGSEQGEQQIIELERRLDRCRSDPAVAQRRPEWLPTGVSQAVYMSGVAVRRDIGLVGLRQA